MRIYRVLLSLLCGAALWMPASSRAQDDAGLSPEEQVLLAYVQGAFDHLAGVTSLAVDGQQTTTQILSSPVLGTDEIHTSVIQDTTLEAQLGPDGSIVASASVVDSTSEISGFLGLDISQVMQMEAILVDDTYYMNVSRYEDSLGSPNPYPVGWINLSDDSASVIGMETFDVEGLVDYSRQIMPFGELTDVIVQRIREEAVFDADGRQMRVFVIEYDMPGVAENGLGSLPGIYSEDALAGLGMDAEAMLQLLFENAVMYQTIWVGADDQLPYRIKSELQLSATIEDPASGEEIHIFQTARSLAAISNYNAPVTIEAPMVEE